MTRYAIASRMAPAQITGAQLRAGDYLDVSEDGFVDGVWGGHRCAGEVREQADHSVIVWQPIGGTPVDPSTTDFRQGCRLFTVVYNDVRTLWERQ